MEGIAVLFRHFKKGDWRWSSEYIEDRRGIRNLGAPRFLIPLLSSIYSELHRQSPFLKCRNRTAIPSTSKKTLSLNHETSLWQNYLIINRKICRTKIDRYRGGINSTHIGCGHNRCVYYLYLLYNGQFLSYKFSDWLSGSSVKEMFRGSRKESFLKWKE